MSSTTLTPEQSRVETLVRRLERGAELLFDLEQRGESDSLYSEWFEHWTTLLAEYEAEAA